MTNQLELRRFGAQAMQWNPFAKFLFLVRGQFAIDLHDVGLEDIVRWGHHSVRKLAVIGHQQQAFAVIVETPDRVDPLSQSPNKLHDGLAPFRIEHRCHAVLRLIQHDVHLMLRRMEQAMIHLNVIARDVGFRAEFRNDYAVHHHVAFANQHFRLAAAGDTGLRKNLLQSLFRH